jgi:hypothetical protein
MAASREDRHVKTRKVKPVPLPVSELALDRAGANSPFGDDLAFPLVAVAYEHPDPTVLDH